MDTKFWKMINEYVIIPFGKRLNQELTEVFIKLDFPERAIKGLRESNDGRKSQRKPQTPSKIQKEQINPNN